MHPDSTEKLFLLIEPQPVPFLKQLVLVWKKSFWICPKLWSRTALQGYIFCSIFQK